ncbi:flagellin [Sphingomonas oryzagri]|jgi:flagellin-like hook-associated protein FlgL|uniref:Flagellin n=1 Tax=Sphingomonas oryzagri TaxID=3042314 RepID=A0ABT6N303_9SPHN|nr:flagellin [Sphingomonas oryzagri]MDH7639644.1 flagellin [Sphingomonas oryzagri]
MLNTSYSLTSQIQNQQALENQISDLNYDISSQVKVHVASDDPAAAAQIAQIGRQQSANAVYTSNVTNAKATTSLVDTSLSSIQTSVQRAKELMLSASNGTMSADDRTAAITELQGIQQSLQTASQATDASGNPLYAKGSPTQIPIGDGVTIAAGESYDDVFGSVSLSNGGTQSLDTILSNAISSLQGDSSGTLDQTAVNSAMDALDDASTHISSAQSDLGVRETRLNNATDDLANSATNLTTSRSALEDTDVTEAYTQMQQKMTILNAAQSMLAQISKTSLFDKLS